MNNPIEGLNKVFESRIKLGVMSILQVNDWVNYNALKDYLEVTDGNLASHLRSLENLNFIEVRKQFVGRKPQTTYRCTSQGREAFQVHLKALEKLIKNRT